MKKQAAFTFLEMILVVGIIALMASLSFIDFAKLRAQTDWHQSLDWMQSTLTRQALRSQSSERVEDKAVCFGLKWTLGQSFEEGFSLYNQGECQDDWQKTDRWFTKLAAEAEADGEVFIFLYPPEAKELKIRKGAQELLIPYAIKLQEEDRSQWLRSKARIPYFTWSAE